jgi:hypothetical protein
MSAKKSLLEALAVSGVEAAAGGQAFIYDYGTTTLATVYDDEDATTIAANPVQLDADGKATVYTDGPVRVRIEDSQGGEVETIDRANTETASEIDIDESLASGGDLESFAESAVASFGDKDFLYKPTGGATARPLYKRIRNRLHIDDYGAVGNGSSDDTAAFVACRAALTSLGGGVIELGPTTYAFATELIISGSDVVLEGQGENVTAIKNLSGVGNGVRFVNGDDVGIRDCKIIASVSTGAGLSFEGCQTFHTCRVKVLNHYIGVDVYESSTRAVRYGSLVDTRVIVENNAAAIALRFGRTGASTFANYKMRVDGGYYTGQGSGKSLFAGDVGQVSFYGVGSGTTSDGTWDLNPAVLTRGYTFVGCYNDGAAPFSILLGQFVRDFAEHGNHYGSSPPTITDAATAASGGGGRIWGSQIIGRTGRGIGTFTATTPGPQTVVGTSGITVDLSKGDAFAVISNAAGVHTITFAIPTNGVKIHGQLIYIHMQRIGAGLPTWTFTAGAGGYDTDAAGTPVVVNDNRVFTFMYHSTVDRWILASAPVTIAS